jgi:hypothetical protein
VSNQLADITPIKDIFMTYHSGEFGDIKDKLELFEADEGGEEARYVARKVTASLAQLALQDRRADVLKLCLDRGFTYENYFIDAANNLERDNPDSEICEVLQESDFRKMWPWPIPKEEGEEGEEGEETPPWEAFDYGGSHPVDW